MSRRRHHRAPRAQDRQDRWRRATRRSPWQGRPSRRSLDLDGWPGPTGWAATLLLLPAGVVATLAAATGSAAGSERLFAGTVGGLGLVFGAGALAPLLPARWDAPTRLWRWGGWLPAVAVLVLGVVLVVGSGAVAEASTRVSRPVFSVLRGLLAVAVGLGLGRAWLRTAFGRDE